MNRVERVSREDRTECLMHRTDKDWDAFSLSNDRGIWAKQDAREVLDLINDGGVRRTLESRGHLAHDRDETILNYLSCDRINGRRQLRASSAGTAIRMPRT